ncbi:hypothetical protein [Polyangium aurulentum]|uniref:hypothetical protein n=1 Tax=Polyangium aurulentum TaxID=2567896 RepID=UPI0010ADB29D|nr:hypothetical protein [Polyangium aurulentum]UQA56270.1 hypothetical protein E8A73_033880 [Polyangium aurulentum]
MGPVRSKPGLLTGASRLRDVALLALSALVVVVGSASQRDAAEAAEGPLPPDRMVGMSPLPGGAPMRAVAAVDAPTPQGGCGFPDRGFGDYLGYRPLPLGKVLVPSSLAVAPDGGYDLLVHFHGLEPVRKQLAVEGLGLVIAGLDTGTLSGAYERMFSDPAVFDAMLSSINREVAGASGHPGARPRSLVLTSWSAGYGAISKILGAGRDDVDAVVLLDSLHAGYAATGHHNPDPAQLAPFASLARAAAQGGPILFVTHSAVPTPDYASTTETGSFLLREIGAQVAPPQPPDGDPFGLSRAYEQNHFFLRGYAGGDGDAHCGQLRLLPAILRDHVLPALRQ